MIARSTGAVWDTVTNVSPARSRGLIVFERGETVVARQDHNQRLLHEKTKCQVWQRSFLSEKGSVDCSFRKAPRK